MARIERLLILPLALSLAGTTVLAGDQDGEDRKGKDGKRDRGYKSPELQNVRRAIEALSPEERKRFEENFSKWANLPPEEKRSLRHREEMRRKWMEKQIDEAAQQAGLVLEGERKEQFAVRYAEERRKLEEELRRELEEKRKPRLDAILAELAKEFGAADPSAATP